MLAHAIKPIRSGKTSALFLTAAFLLTATASAAESWRMEGAWDIRLTAENPPTCFARRTMEDESTVEIGFDPAGEGGYFGIYNPAWTHIKEGEKGTVTFDFEEEKFAGDAFGRYWDGVPGGYAFFNNPAFAEAFARRNSVKLSGSNGRSFEMDLNGTARAVAAVRECQAEQTPSSE